LRATFYAAVVDAGIAAGEKSGVVAGGGDEDGVVDQAPAGVGGEELGAFVLACTREEHVAAGPGSYRVSCSCWECERG